MMKQQILLPLLIQEQLHLQEGKIILKQQPLQHHQTLQTLVPRLLRVVMVVVILEQLHLLEEGGIIREILAQHQPILVKNLFHLIFKCYFLKITHQIIEYF